MRLRSNSTSTTHFISSSQIQELRILFLGLVESLVGRVNEGISGIMGDYDDNDS